jgi:Domain of unknown function (DUF4833)
LGCGDFGKKSKKICFPDDAHFLGKGSQETFIFWYLLSTFALLFDQPINMNYKIWILWIGLLPSVLWAQKKNETPALPATPEKYPHPPQVDNRLFFIQRSPNIDVVVYDAVLQPNKTLNPQNPVHGYWYRFSEGGKTGEFNAIQRTLAYGAHTKALPNETGVYEMHVGTYKKKKFKIAIEKGVPVALIPINGRTAILHHIFVKVEETGHLIPKVPWVALYGKDLKTGEELKEVFKP